MKKLLFSYLSIVVITLMMISCGGGEETYFNKVNIKDGGLIRGASLNESIELIKKLEDTKSLTDEEDDYLEYEYFIKEDDSYIVTYFFDDKGCYEINLDTYFDLSTDAKSVFEGYKSHFTNKFGEAEDEDEYLTWDSEDGATTVEIDYSGLESGQVNIAAFANE